MDVNNREIFCLGCFNVFRFCDCIDSYDVDGLLNGDDNEKEKDKDDAEEIANPDPELENFNPGQPGPAVVTPSPKKRKPPKQTTPPTQKPTRPPPKKYKVRPGKQTTLTDEYTDYNPTDGKTPFTPEKRKDPPLADPFDDTAVAAPVSQKPRVDPSTLTDYGDGVTFVDLNEGSPTQGQKFDKDGYPAGPLGRPVEDVYFRPDRSESTKKLEDMQDEILATPENYKPTTKKQICVLGGPPLTTWIGPDGWTYGKDETKDGPVTWEDVYFPVLNDSVGKFPEGRQPPEPAPSALPIGIVPHDVRAGGKGAKLPYAPPYFFPDTGIEPTYYPIVPIVPPSLPLEDPCPPHRNNVCNTVGLTGLGTIDSPFVGGLVERKNIGKFILSTRGNTLNSVSYPQNRFGNFGDTDNTVQYLQDPTLPNLCAILCEMKNEQSPVNAGYYGMVIIKPLPGTSIPSFRCFIQGYSTAYLKVYSGSYTSGDIPVNDAQNNCLVASGQPACIIIPPGYNNRLNTESLECIQPYIFVVMGNSVSVTFESANILRKTTTQFIEHEPKNNLTGIQYKKPDGTLTGSVTGGKYNTWPENWQQINQRNDGASVTLNPFTLRSMSYLGYGVAPFNGSLQAVVTATGTTSLVNSWSVSNPNFSQWLLKPIPTATNDKIYIDSNSSNIVDFRIFLLDIINWID